MINIGEVYNAKPGCVFISYQPKWADHNVVWRRAKLATIKRRGWTDRIIRCAHCGRAATRLDRHWPYMSGANKCAWHKNSPILD